MLDTGFEAGAFQAIWNNESTMYVVLDDLFAAHSRLLARGGRYVTITGCYNDVYGLPSKPVSTINAHYVCDIHPRSAYFRAMAANRLVPTTVVDLTADTIPYWELPPEGVGRHRHRGHLPGRLPQRRLPVPAHRRRPYLSPPNRPGASHAV